ncbi:hypothetical protein F4779DRAFT_577155 [Xylariaceae sp. FL0662B]|nr:hypothetical protein F4779DRAFT_577155 [Xylariaceae sp. FL0662B]
MFVLLPITIIWRLNMNLRQKLGLVLLMGASFFTVIASLLRTIWLNVTLGWYHGKPVDINYDAALSVLWVGLEQCIVIILGCVPPIHALGSVKFPYLNSLIRRNWTRQPSGDSEPHDYGMTTSK